MIPANVCACSPELDRDVVACGEGSLGRAYRLRYVSRQQLYLRKRGKLDGSCIRILVGHVPADAFFENLDRIRKATMVKSDVRQSCRSRGNPVWANLLQLVVRRNCVVRLAERQLRHRGADIPEHEIR